MGAVVKLSASSSFGRIVASRQSRVAKAESGDTSVSLDLLIKSLLAAGVETQELAGAVGGRNR